jgi:hypothetical protein
LGYLSRVSVSPPGSYSPRAIRERSSEGEAPQTGTAVVAVAPIEKKEASATLRQRPAAPFLAHLIATDRDAPQTRERRRATPSDASAAYAARQGRPVRSGVLLSLSA